MCATNDHERRSVAAAARLRRVTMAVEPSIAVEVGDLPETLAEEWNELAVLTDACPFARPGWITAWRAAFGRGHLVVLSARRAGQLVGVLPLERRLGTLRSPTNAHTPVFGHVAVDEGVTRALAGRAFAESAREVTLERLDAGSPLLREIGDAATDSGYREVTRTIDRSPYVPTAGGSFARSISRNLRHDVERRTRRLSELGAVSVEVRDGSENLTGLLHEGFDVELRGWKGARSTAIASRSATRDFYAQVARWACSSGWLRLVFLRLDDRPIAFQFDLEVGETYYSLKIGYDPAYQTYSPGKLLAYNMIARASARRVRTYELLGMDEPWKSRFTDVSRERVTVRAFAASPAGRLARAAHVYGRPLARRVPLASRAAAIRRR